MTDTTDTADAVAMVLGGGLILVGVVVLGLVETLAGKPYAPAPLTNDAGTVIATPLIDPNVRTAFVVAGLLVFLLYGGYKLATPYVGAGDTTPAGATT